jgi:hypothetical protein
MGDTIMPSIIRATTTSGLQVAPDNSGSLQLQTNGTTTAVTIDTSQNVGIGTASPSSKLNVNGKVTLTGGEDNQIEWNNNSQLWRLNNSSAGQFYLYDVTGAKFPFKINAGSGNDSIAITSTSIAFGVGGTERMRIDSSGNVLMGATSNPSLSWTSANRLYVDQSTADFVCHVRNSSTTTANNYGLAISYAATPNNTGQAFIDIRDSTAQRLQVRSNGGIANFSANNVNLSDEREKKDIQLAGSYLDKICAIPVKTFLFNDQTDTDINLGVIAQDVQAVAPELVSESNWGTEEEPKERLSIYQTDLQYALMKCIQEQQTIINDLKARVTALEAK